VQEFVRQHVPAGLQYYLTILEATENSYGYVNVKMSLEADGAGAFMAVMKCIDETKFKKAKNTSYEGYNNGRRNVFVANVDFA
jgi:hypothetical protein